MQREYVLERTSTNKLNPAKLKQQLAAIRKAVMANKTIGAAAKNKGRLKPSVDEGESNYRYSVKLIVSVSREGDKGQEDLDFLEKIIRKSAQLQKWHLVGEAEAVELVTAGTKTRPPWHLEVITPEVFQTHFSEIIDREAHLRTMHKATEMYLRSEGKLRSHTILYGKPGACKTNMCLALKNWYERDSDVERVHCADATALTKAGLENWLLDHAEAGSLPEILLLEEIEKFDMNVLLPLGSMMDGRGVITKLNARVNRRAKTNILVWMTCNNEDFVRKWNKGYIWSRCTHKIPCDRPTREQMENLILPQKILQIGGNPDWAKPACDFAFDVLRTDDPREIIGLLDGQDDLLSGKYQEDQMKILGSKRLRALQDLKIDVDRDEFI
jgi:hypothetical protein